MAHKDHPQRRQGSQHDEQERRFYNGEFDQHHDQDSSSGHGPQDSQREYNQRSWQQGAFGSQAGRGVGDGENRNTPDAGHHNPSGYYGQGDTGQRSYGEPSRDAQHQDQFDPDYRQWRNEQMQSLDDDYRNWRRDRYKKFADEFSTWRSSRDKSAQGSASGSEDPSRSNATGSGADTTN